MVDILPKYVEFAQFSLDELARWFGLVLVSDEAINTKMYCYDSITTISLLHCIGPYCLDGSNGQL